MCIRDREVPGSNSLVVASNGASQIGHIWRVVWSYATSEPFDKDDVPDGFTQWSSSTRAEFVEAWRAYEPSLHGLNAGTASTPPATDSGGTARGSQLMSIPSSLPSATAGWSAR